ncbi:MAG: hypothetical protein HND51_05690 [Chloroflexi bacterium]|nr:hypothetical protein [Chloroflexota bacterium]
MIKTIYCKLLRLYPAVFYRKFSGEMAALFASRLEDVGERGPLGIVFFITREFIGALFGSIRERLNELKREPRCIGRLRNTSRIDPRIGGAILLSIGFGLAQGTYFLVAISGGPMMDHPMMDLLAGFLGRGFLALMLPEALALVIGSVFIFGTSVRARKLLFMSLMVASCYVIGFGLQFRSSNLFGQFFLNVDKSIWVMHRFVWMAMIGLLMGYVLEVALSRKWKPGMVTLFAGSSLFAADVIGYGSFALFNLVMGIPIFGPWPMPEYYYLHALQAIVKGMILGIGLGYIRKSHQGNVLHREVLTE